MAENICATCGGYNTNIRNPDIDCCSECGGVEFLWSDEYTETEWEQLMEKRDEG